MEATIKFYTDKAERAFLGDAVIELPYYGIQITVRLTVGRDGRAHVSWPQDTTSIRPRFWACGMDSEAGREWEAWILGKYREFTIGGR